MTKTFHTLYCILIAVLLWSPLQGQVWNYSVPQAGYDANDISFYQACDRGRLPEITADRPRSIILCIGDGMGFNQIALARQRAVGLGGLLHMESLPFSGIVRTSSANSVVTDSAAAATAMSCGVKTNNGMIGMTPDKQRCRSILEALDQKGWRTGLVVTSTLSHATPAAFAAHVEHRKMEAEIAAQMLQGGTDILFGGGKAYWIAEGGLRKDHRDLIAEAGQAGFQMVYTDSQMEQLKTGRAVGLFADGGMTTFEPEPALVQMTKKALELLSARSSDWFAPAPRFFLMVEGSQIDWACHNNDTTAMIRQLLLFDMAVKEALDFAVRDKRTLVIVMADHETGGLTLHEGKDFSRFQVRWSSKGHTGADVPLFVYGPGAEQFCGTLDNTGIFRRLAGLTSVCSKQ